ncbi:hypothetical protein MUN82_08625 [Hymenobacter aerilatus]|uniref:Uncharacterized protein n=1 Tax=Hymenobacter aerilatus TaxID=2932251 RepID=A0A8T9SZV2_9BACT|nr:hypothetical protein [Hymenobacter aerilatus]UOR07147.1 hypothetical protein MUN82_08625 [Hymenobacter aerilatus]
MNLQDHLPSVLFGPHGTVYAILLGAGFIAVWLGFTVVWGMTRPPNSLTRLLLNTVAPLGDPRTPRELNSRRTLTYLLIPLFIGILIQGFFFTSGPVKFSEDQIRVIDAIAALLVALVGLGTYRAVKANSPPETQINTENTTLNGPNNVSVGGEENMR